MKINVLYSSIISFAIGIGLMAYLVEDRPEVLYSNKSGACIKVISAKTGYDCDRLPKRYRKVWID